MRQIKLVIAALFLISPFAANADPITYDVDRTIGDGTVTGYITTDGTIGALAAGNIVDWSITIFAPNLGDGPTATIGTGDRFQMIGGSVTSTATDLSFNSLLNGFFIAQGVGGNYWCLTGPGVTCGYGPQWESIGFNEDGTTGAQGVYIGENDSYVFARTAAVPEPGTLALLGIGLFGMGLARRNKKV